MDNFDIIACFDSGFVMTTGVMMYSVCVNNPDMEIVFHLLVDKSVVEEEKKSLMKTVTAFAGKKIVFYDIDGNSVKHYGKKRKNDNHISLATFYRLYISDILPQNIHKVLYLDGDIIVRHSLSSLWHISLDGVPLAAIPDSLSSNKSLYNRLGYPYEYGYFNAGVMLINLDYWREHEVTKLFSEYIMEVKEKLIYGDQDILNAVFFDKKLLLPTKYNLIAEFLHPWLKLHELIDPEELQDAMKNPIILHYTGEKPWAHWYNITDNHPYASTFFKYQQQTCWKDWTVKDRRPMNMRLRHFVANLLRSLKLKSPVPRNYIDMPPID